MKLILFDEIVSVVSPYLPDDIQTVCLDRNGNLSSAATNAEVIFDGFYLERLTLHQVLETAPNIRWHHTVCAGVDHLLTSTFLERNIVLTNSAGVCAKPIAEFVLAFILNHAKKLSILWSLKNQFSWYQNFDIQELTGKTLLIVGAGSIGQAIAVRANAFGMCVVGVCQNPRFLPGFGQVVGADEWHSFLPNADYLVIAAPLTRETRGMINLDVLRLMPQSAYLINIARGGLVDEAALLHALRENWIAGAALDAFNTEPLPPDSPFWKLSNVFVTPHCSNSSPQNLQRSIELFLNNLARYRSGQPLLNVVDQKAGY